MMSDYNKLLEALRYCDQSHFCRDCPVYATDKCTSLLKNAADAIVKLQAQIKNDRKEKTE